MTDAIDNAIISKYLIRFLLILLRSSIVFMMLPAFSSKNVPAQYKIGLAIATAILLTPIVEAKVEENQVFYLIVKEVVFAMVIGMGGRLVFLAVNMAGQLMSNTMAMTMATLIDPEFGQSAELSRLLGIFATVVFFAIDAHHDLLWLLVKSYEIVPFGKINLDGLMLKGMEILQKAFIFAIKISIPVVVGMIVTHLMLGFVYKASPSLNIFFVSYPVFITLGFIIMMVSVPEFLTLLTQMFKEMSGEIQNLLSIARQ
ncbi:MAG: flagellar biosynthetic protein FliR [Candidatus Magnetoovum sp. WYHC-5]|nr:flagellar biosynthetic protein FliR [Candidatus Magnetoovum sp. WYHC-5]